VKRKIYPQKLVGFKFLVINEVNSLLIQPKVAENVLLYTFLYQEKR